jgi:toxin HigB-1
MIISFRHKGLQHLFTAGKTLKDKTQPAESIIIGLDIIDAARNPREAAFAGFRFEEWTEDGSKRFGVMVSNHWRISFGWSGEHAIDVDLERTD